MSLSKCIPWMIVGLAESTAIVTINLCELIVFIKNPDLCMMRSTRLLIILVIDILAGIFVLYGLVHLIGAYCKRIKLVFSLTLAI